MPRDQVHHRVHVAGLRTGTSKVTVLEMGGRNLQRVADPLSGGKTAPGVRCPCRRTWTAIHINRPVQRTHELDVVSVDFAREGIYFFKDASATQAAPLMGRRMGAALVFR